jgi:phenylacetate-CoA ligase
MIRLLHRLTFTGPAQPVFDSLTRRRYRKAYRGLMRTQWLSRDELRGLQLERLSRVLEHAYRYSPFHRDRLGAAGWTPGSVATFELLRDLPVLERNDLQDRLDEVATVSRFKFERLDTVTSSSTTTGRPIESYNSGPASDSKGAARLRTNRWAGHRPGEKICFFGGATIPPGRRPLPERAWYALKGRKTVPHWDVSDDALDRAEREIRAFRPKLLMCYPSTSTQLTMRLRERGIRLAVPAVLFSGEAVTDQSRQLAREVLGARVFETYGCVELGDCASTCPDCREIHVQDENVILETEPGTGDLLATDLTNLATPLLRYRVGDRGLVSEEQAACGRGLGTLKRIEGRIMDLIELRDGRRISLFTFLVLFRHFPQVRGYQAWQTAAGELQLLVQGLTPEVETEMRGRLDANIEGLAVEILPVASIPATSAGKRPFLVRGRRYIGQEVIPPA